jgi:hypothetical protein
MTSQFKKDNSKKREEFNKKQKVRYKPTGEIGYVSSQNKYWVFVKFERAVKILGFEGATSEACKPNDLEITG